MNSLNFIKFFLIYDLYFHSISFGLDRYERNQHPFTIWLLHIFPSSSSDSLGFRLNYGLDYKGNICGDKHADPDLRELEVRYWVNPNQIYQSGVKDSQFKLADARSVCLMECPMPSEDGISWVCDYPEGDIKISMDDWIDRDYDYYEFLTPEMRNSSLQLQGPCYPVIFPSVNGQCSYSSFRFDVISLG